MTRIRNELTSEICEHHRKPCTTRNNEVSPFKNIANPWLFVCTIQKHEVGFLCVETEHYACVSCNFIISNGLNNECKQYNTTHTTTKWCRNVVIVTEGREDMAECAHENGTHHRHKNNCRLRPELIEIPLQTIMCCRHL